METLKVYKYRLSSVEIGSVYMDYVGCFPTQLTHLESITKERDECMLKLNKTKDLEAVVLRRKIKQLNYEIKNHTKLYPEEYV